MLLDLLVSNSRTAKPFSTYCAFLIYCDSLPDKAPYTKISYIYTNPNTNRILPHAHTLCYYFLIMGSRLPSYRIWQICVALYYGWAVEWIVAATQVHRATIYRIRTSLDVWGTPYPPSLAKIGRPRLLTALHKKVRDT